MPRVLIYGNSGSGKTTMARALAEALGVPCLDLDAVAWEEPGERRPLDESVADIEAFVTASPDWVVEGSYGSLVEAVLPHCTELRFLNPGVEACVAHARRRPWEPEKYDSAEAQDRMLEFLIEWIRTYDARPDEYGLAAHRAIFERFDGPKQEYGVP